MPEPFITYAQNQEDIVLWRTLGDVSDGSYIDVGAAHPTIDSVTFAFYRAGWSGLNVEPTPALAKELRDCRPRDINAECAIGNSPGQVDLFSVPETGLSTLVSSSLTAIQDSGHSVEIIPIQVRRLGELLDEVWSLDRPIHFMKVDVEGFEEEVLASIDLERWQPWVVVVEATMPMSTELSHGAWEHHLVDAGYHFCLFDGLNRFYVSPGHLELAGRMSYPACTFDQPYERADYVAAAAEARAIFESTIDALRVERMEIIDRMETTDIALESTHEALRSTEAHATGLEIEVATTNARIEALEEAHSHLRTAHAHLEATHTALGARLEPISRDRASARRAQLIAEAYAAQMGRHSHELDQQRLGLRRELDAAYGDLAEVRLANTDARQHLAQVFQTVSWRVTKPLRAVRRAGAAARLNQERPTQPTKSPDSEVVAERAVAQPDLSSMKAFCRRLRQVTGQIASVAPPAETPAFDGSEAADCLDSLEQALAAGSGPKSRQAWLALVSADGRYPTEGELQAAERMLVVGGPSRLVEAVRERFLNALRRGDDTDIDLEIISGAVIVDVTHTAEHNLHTGIQRVVRETAGRWLADEAAIAVRWNFDGGRMNRLSTSDTSRFVNWRDHQGGSGAGLERRDLADSHGSVVVPIDSTFIIPELAGEIPRCDAYRALGQSRLLTRFGMIGYDLIPMTASETVAEGMPNAFAAYLSVVKHATHISAISHTTAHDYSAFCSSLLSQGVAVPVVVAHSLPPGTVTGDASSTGFQGLNLGIGASPLVLVVGSHEPRKNHLAVLAAAELLWREAFDFSLLFVGGSGWRDEEFGREVERLESEGWPVHVRRRVTEDELWAAYDRASFTMFPSLVEGFGLPIAESLLRGVPVITSNYGAMAEVAQHGGVLLADPRNIDELRSSMRLLLADSEVLARLGREARDRVWPTWNAYSSDVWNFLIGSERDSARIPEVGTE